MQNFNLSNQIKKWGLELGFSQVAIADIDLAEHEANLKQWLAQSYHGTMNYMQQHGTKRTRPQELIPGTNSIIMVSIDYLPAAPHKSNNIISRYATGRDYHRLIRNKLKKLALRIKEEIGDFNYRPFADSAPVSEKALAANSGLGWIGKHTILLNRKHGSWMFLGAMYTDLSLPTDKPIKNNCGSCSACIDVCPTKAIIAPYKLDARRCISYLTIEYKGVIPIEFRKAIGNHIFGCDDCQLVCPWNRFAKITAEPDFKVRHGLDTCNLIDLFNWSEEEFLKYTQGSAMRRVGYECWLRNIAIALGNANKTPEVVAALQSRLNSPSELVKEHVKWAMTV